jgi:hypothetical protein
MFAVVQLVVEGLVTSRPYQFTASLEPSTRKVHVAGVVPLTLQSIV